MSAAVVTVVGARPQFVKAAAVSQALRRHAREVLVHTGQHYDDELSQVFFRELGLPAPDHHLGVGSGTHAEQTARVIERLAPVLDGLRPAGVIVFGDTNSTLGAAIAAAQLRLPVAHVEAGLRSGDRSMPEELNRIVTDHVSDLLLCPTPHAVANLEREGITRGVHLVGDVMRDVLERFLPCARERAARWLTDGREPGRFGMVTLHRAGNTDDDARLRALSAALLAVREPVLFPIHPRTERALRRNGTWDALQAHPTLRCVPPLGYLDFLGTLSHARWVATDSGGVQKEACLLRVPCVTLRDRTEWVETVETGWNTLLGDDVQRLAAVVSALDGTGGAPCRPPHPAELYGDGHAAERVAERVLAGVAAS